MILKVVFGEGGCFAIGVKLKRVVDNLSSEIGNRNNKLVRPEE